MEKQLKDWLKFWKKVDNNCDREILSKQLKLIRKEAQKERDLLWFEKMKENVNFKKGDAEKVLHQILYKY